MKGAPRPSIAERLVALKLDLHHDRIVAADALADLTPYRQAVAVVRVLRGLHPSVLEAAELLEAEVRRREQVQERAERVACER